MQRHRRCGLLPATCRGADKGGVSLFQKEIPLPYTLPEKICIASVRLEELRRLPIATCCARRSRVERCYTTCLCSYSPLLRSRWRLCCLTDAAHPLRVPLCPSRRGTDSSPAATNAYRFDNAYCGERSYAASAGNTRIDRIRSRTQLCKGNESQAKRQRR